MRLRHLQWTVLFLAIAMAIGFPAFRRGNRARASATILARGPAAIEVALMTSRPVLRDALADPLYRLTDLPILQGSTDPAQTLDHALHITPRPGTNLIELAAEADTRTEAATLVDAVLMAYLRTRPSSTVQVVRSTTSVSSAWHQPHFAVYLFAMVAGFVATVAWFAVLVRLVLRIRRQAHEVVVIPPEFPAERPTRWDRS